MFGIFAKLILSFSFIILLMAMLFYLMKKFYLPNASFRGFGANIKIYEKFQIQPRKTIYLVKVINKILVLGISENSFSVLTEINEPELVRALDEIYSFGDGKNGNLLNLKRGSDSGR
ncbi:MAG: FliO/MopB family protein [Candidatus Kryptonium sp.]